MKIAIIGAMEEEILLLQSQLDGAQSIKVNHLNIHHGFVGNDSGGKHEIFLVQSGIGKVASALATTILIHKYSADLLINTGSAGGFDPDLSIGDIVIATSLMYHDVDVSHFGYERGQVPSMPKEYLTDEHASEVARQCASKLEGIQTRSGLICSGDSFIGSDEAAQDIRSAFEQMKAVEMEGASIAQACFMLETPCVVIRSLSDIAGKTSTVSFESYLEKAAKNSANLVLETIKAL
ncbi:5'-methylthioadenosine/adenosylhomocysteine nucleosidase [Ningiella sp. W23]|uniref:5'-methylthioadenosine/adenosylhomocysteine nucleosidase n=1 Tax=Ningiella sp. W23 TaxID=3023715 RepID=UPI003756D81A